MREAYRVEPPPHPVVTAGGEVQAARINCSVHRLGNHSVTKSRPVTSLIAKEHPKRGTNANYGLTTIGVVHVYRVPSS